jgi:beta-glucosidase
VDVNNNPLNPVINVRSFGETPETVSALIQAFLRGCQAYPVLTTAKHFPGHGDTAIDSHLDLPLIPHDRARLEAVEWQPFRSAIEAQVSSMMTAHLALPALDPDYPATLSAKILTGILRQEWGFEGIIVTDALIMQAITQRYGAVEAPVLALEAGADVILMPVDPPAAIEGIMKAVETGRLTEARIEASLQRIWRAKQRVTTLGQDSSSGREAPLANPIVQLLGATEPLAALSCLAEPEGHTLARSILSRSQTVGGLVPAVEGGVNLILVDNLLQVPFLSPQAPAVKQPDSFGYRCQVLDQTSAHHGPYPLPPTLLQLFVRGNPFRGLGSTHPWMQEWLKSLLAQERLKALVVYGSPYAWETLRSFLPPDLPCGFTYGQMPIAQKILLGSLFATGVGQNKDQLEFTT